MPAKGEWETKRDLADTYYIDGVPRGFAVDNAWSIITDCKWVNTCGTCFSLDEAKAAVEAALALPDEIVAALEMGLDAIRAWQSYHDRNGQMFDEPQHAAACAAYVESVQPLITKLKGEKPCKDTANPN